VNESVSARPALTFFFPAYNEEANIKRTVARAIDDVGPLADSLEVLAIDDGSTDRTPQLADELAAADPRVRGQFISPTAATAAPCRRGLPMRAGS